MSYCFPMVRVPTAAGSAEDSAADVGALLKTPGAMTLLRAYVALEDRHQRAALVKLLWALVEQERAREGDASVIDSDN